MKPVVRRSGAVAAATVGLLGLGVALAAWTSTGEGSGNVDAATAKPLTVTVTDVNGLYPTGSVDVPFTVTNPNPYDVTVTSVTLKNVTVDGAHSGCATSVISGTDLTGLSLSAAADGGSTNSRNLTVAMSNAATDACQGATFTVTLEATALSS